MFHSVIKFWQVFNFAQCQLLTGVKFWQVNKFVLCRFRVDQTATPKRRRAKLSSSSRISFRQSRRTSMTWPRKDCQMWVLARIVALMTKILKIVYFIVYLFLCNFLAPCLSFFPRRNFCRPFSSTKLWRKWLKCYLRSTSRLLKRGRRSPTSWRLKLRSKDSSRILLLTK